MTQNSLNYDCIVFFGSDRRTKRGWLRPAHYARAREATPRPRSGAEAERTSCPKGGSQEELPHVRGQGKWPRVPGCDGAKTPRGATPRPRSRAAAGRSYPASEVKGGGWEDEPHVKGVVAVWAQEGLEELSHGEGQEGRQ